MRKALSIAAIAVVALTVAPSASAKSDQTRSLISPGTCTTITKLANEGKPVQDPSILHDADSVPSYFQSGVLKYTRIGETTATATRCGNAGGVFEHVGHTPRFSGEKERPREHRPWNYVAGDLLFLPVAGAMG